MQPPVLLSSCLKIKYLFFHALTLLAVTRAGSGERQQDAPFLAPFLFLLLLA